MANDKTKLLEELKNLQTELKEMSTNIVDHIGDFLDGSLLEKIQATEKDLEELIPKGLDFEKAMQLEQEAAKERAKELIESDKQLEEMQNLVTTDPSFSTEAPLSTEAPPPIPEGESKEITKFSYKSDNFNIEVDLLSGLKMQVPTDWCGTSVVFEIKGEYSKKGELNVYIDDKAYFNMQIKSNYQYDSEKEAHKVKVGISHESRIFINTAKTPQAVKAEVEQHGKDLKKAYDKFSTATDEFEKELLMIDMIKAVSGMYSAIDDLNTGAEEAVLFKVGAESQFFMKDGLPLEHTHMIVISINF